MASITISDLHPTGSELFSDSESYMNELSDGEFEAINGGLTPALLWSATVAAARYYSLRLAARSSLRCLNASIALTNWRPR